MLPQRDSILSLLADEDSDSAALVQNQLAARGPAVLADLRELLPAAKGRAERRLKEVIVQVAGDEAEQKFGKLCAAFGNDGDIEAAAWTLAEVVAPGEDFDAQRQQLDELGATLARRLRGKDTVIQQCGAMSALLGSELGFRGNEDDYYAEENSLLPRVIDDRRGNPITLCLIYIAVGRRAGLPVQGVGLPGHFVVRMGGVFLDPFHGGRRLQLEDCQKLLESQGLELQPHHLLPCKPRVMLARILNNLLHAAETGDPRLGEKLHGWLQVLQRAAV
ncbi:MAG: transglutaminase-like domain-containing protein [Chthoniobacteraceae bacterium]